MPTMQRHLLSWIEAEVRRCRPIGLRYFRSPKLRVERKADHSPVTIADRTIEEHLRKAISRHCPSDGIVGEEFGSQAVAGAPYWTIDPIDGTRAFSRGLPTWGSLVGRVEKGRAMLGVVDFPALDITLAVVDGTAAYERAQGRVLKLKPPAVVPSLKQSVILHGGAAWWQPTPYRKGFERIVRECFLERAYGDCYGYLWALRGHADAVIDYSVKLWDLVPLAALAQATGRVLTDCSGHLNFHGPEAIFASAAFAKQLSRILTSTQHSANSTQIKDQF
ncbi:MAG: hypothetical protein HYU33_06230 [Candidatus Omnitrophica bacterium]|nr:hypothetical protein [Candidatus Omnitrophota bacterium]